MEVTELIIGDWVTGKKWREKPFQIIRINDNGKFIYGKTTDSIVGPFLVEELEPIPLTLEILKINGFEQNVDNEDRYSFEDTTIIFKHDTEYMFSASVNGSNGMLYLCANYVHELQHALKICGLNDLVDNFKVEE